MLDRTFAIHIACDQVRWVPVGQAWQKARELAPAADRLAMVQAAIADVLANHKKITRLIYPGRADHPQRAIAEKKRILDTHFPRHVSRVLDDQLRARYPEIRLPRSAMGH